MIKAVLMDVDNTLLDFNLSAGEAIKRCCKKFEIPLTGDFLPTFIRINDGLWQEIENKRLTLTELHKIRWNTVFAALNIRFDGEKFEKDFISELFNTAIPVDGAIDLLKYLSQKYMVCAASNAMLNQQINRLKISGIIPYLSKIFNSEEIGVRKPDAKFFEACIRGLSPIKKEEIIMVGDSLSADIEGAENFGIPAVWFNKDGKEYKGERNFITVTSLCQIKNIL